MLRLLKNFDEAIDESGQPQEPFEESSEHDGADNGDIDNLGVHQRRAFKQQCMLEQLTSLLGHGSVMASTPLALGAISMAI